MLVERAHASQHKHVRIPNSDRTAGVLHSDRSLRCLSQSGSGELHARQGHPTAWCLSIHHVYDVNTHHTHTPSCLFGHLVGSQSILFGCVQFAFSRRVACVCLVALRCCVLRDLQRCVLRLPRIFVVTKSCECEPSRVSLLFCVSRRCGFRKCVCATECNNTQSHQKKVHTQPN